MFHKVVRPRHVVVLVAALVALAIPLAPWNSVHKVTAHPAATIVALGDSITYGSEHGGRRAGAPWPAELARRLRQRIRVVDAGIPGNTVGRVPTCRWCGAPAIVRLDADALAVPGIRTLIVLEGINDTMRRGGSAAEIIAGLRQIAARARRRGVRVIAGTLLPDAAYRAHTAARERMRQAVNRWLRTTRVFDAVIDFDRVMRDPADPLRLNPAYDSGDGLHPNARGYRAMGDAVPLILLRPVLRTSSLASAGAFAPRLLAPLGDKLIGK